MSSHNEGEGFWATILALGGLWLLYAFVTSTWPIGLILISAVVAYLVLRGHEDPWLKAAGDLSLGLLVGVALAFAVWIYVNYWGRDRASQTELATIETFLLMTHFKLKWWKAWFEFPWVFATTGILLVVQWKFHSLEVVKWAFEKVAKPLSTVGLAVFTAASFSYFSDASTGELVTRDYESRRLRIISADDESRNLAIEALAARSLSSESPDDSQEDRAYLAHLLFEATLARGDHQEAALVAIAGLPASGEGRARVATAIASTVQGQGPARLPIPERQPASREERADQLKNERDANTTLKRAQVVHKQALVGLRESIARSLGDAAKSVFPNGLPAEIAGKYAQKVTAQFCKDYLKTTVGEARLDSLLRSAESYRGVSQSLVPKAPGADFKATAVAFIESTRPKIGLVREPYETQRPIVDRSAGCECETRRGAVVISRRYIRPGERCGPHVCGQ